MTVWKSFGASVRGPGHEATGTPNQDAWMSFHQAWGDGIAVSDGLGSKPFSNFGSHAACLAVANTVHTCHSKPEIRNAQLSDLIRDDWLSRIAPLESHDCATTCLFAFLTNDGMVRMGLLGDGLVAVVRMDGSVTALYDDKAQGFSNITVALSLNVTEKDWQWSAIPESDIRSIVLCTDGVADDLADVNGFVAEFSDAHRSLSPVTAAHRVRETLKNWPTPKHSDDKTIACLLREEVADE